MRRPEDIHDLRERIAAAGSRARIIAKIEKGEALEHLDAVVDASDVLMVARGDLGVEIGAAEVPLVQKQVIRAGREGGLLVVPPGGELEFLHPLPVERLWGVGVKTAEKLHARGIVTVRQVAELEETVLVELLGRASGRHLHALAHNRDPRRVRTGQRRRSMGSQRALGRRARRPTRSTPP